MVTVAMKRIDMANRHDDMLTHITREGIQILPNTSGVRNAREAVLAAQLAREAFQTNFIKLEIHPDPKYLLPDPVETLAATEELASRPTPCYANAWKKQAPPPSCHWQRQSAQTKGL